MSTRPAPEQVAIGGGGAIYNHGSLTVTDSTLRGNSVLADVPDDGSGDVSNDGWTGGGAVFDDGVTTLDRVLVAGNTVVTKAPANHGDGGGGVYGFGDTVIRNSTVHANSATVSGKVSGGGGIFAMWLDLQSSTVTDNATTGAGGGVLIETFGHFGNSVIAGNGGAECDTSVALELMRAGRNVADDDSCPFEPPDLEGVDPLLGPLADNGGPTWSRLPPAGSPLIDAVPADAPCPKVDQREVARPQGKACDIGAVEFVPQEPDPDPSPTPTASPSPTATASPVADCDGVPGADADRLAGADRDGVSGADCDGVSGADRVAVAVADRDRLSVADRDRLSVADRNRFAFTDGDRFAFADDDRFPRAHDLAGPGPAGGGAAGRPSRRPARPAATRVRRPRSVPPGRHVARQGAGQADRAPGGGDAPRRPPPRQALDAHGRPLALQAHARRHRGPPHGPQDDRALRPRRDDAEAPPPNPLSDS